MGAADAPTQHGTVRWPHDREMPAPEPNTGREFGLRNGFVFPLGNPDEATPMQSVVEAKGVVGVEAGWRALGGFSILARLSYGPQSDGRRAARNGTL